MNKSLILGIMATLCITHNDAMDSKKSLITRKSSVPVPLPPKKKITIVNTSLASATTSHSHKQKPTGPISLPHTGPTQWPKSSALLRPRTNTPIVPLSTAATMDETDVSLDLGIASLPATPGADISPKQTSLHQEIAMSAEQKAVFLDDTQTRIETIEAKLSEIKNQMRKTTSPFTFAQYEEIKKVLLEQRTIELLYKKWLEGIVPSANKETLPYLTIEQAKSWCSYLKKQPKNIISDDFTKSLKIKGPLVEDEGAL